MKPTSSDPKLFNEIADGTPVEGERLDAALERYETKVFVYERPNATADSSRVLIESAQAANFTIVSALTRALERDIHCKGFTLLADNVSGIRFSEEKDALALQQVHASDHVLSDIPAGPYASALILYEPTDSAAPVLLESAKSVFEAQRLYYFSPGLLDEKARETFSPRNGNLEKIDAIYVADDFAKRLFCGVLELPQDRVDVAGSPLIDGIFPEEANALRASGREKLGIADNAVVVNYSTIVSAAFISVGGSPDLNRLASGETLSGTIEAARTNPSKSFVLLARMHPRAKGVEHLPEPTTDMPPNIQIVVGDELSYEEAIYASDVICANPVSTEVILGAYRGRKTAFLAYGASGGVGDIAKNIYGQKGMDIIENSGRVHMIRSGHELAELLSSDMRQAPLPKPTGNSAERLAKILLGNAS